ncbi:hypothetical protein Tco_1474893 [Tanacetum coccineum]
MTSDHNSSELRIHNHSNKPSSSKLVLKVVPPVDKTATSQHELELLFSHMYEEYFTAGNQSVSKSSALSDNSLKQDTQPTLIVLIHNQFVIRSLKSVNTKTPQAKHSVNHTKKVWKATRNHIVNTTKTAWRPTGKVVGSVKPQWKPTGRHFALYDNCPLTRIMEPIVEPLELTPSVSSSSKVTMISRFLDYNLSDRKAGSKGISVENTQSVGSLERTSSFREQQAFGICLGDNFSSLFNDFIIRLEMILVLPDEGEDEDFIKRSRSTLGEESSNDVDIENMTIAEYNLCVAKQGLGMNPLRAENMKRMGHDIVQDSIWEQDDDSKEDQEDDGDDGDTFDIDETLNVTMVDDEADFNPTKDLGELERPLAK